jgi:hypothetical protein
VCRIDGLQACSGLPELAVLLQCGWFLRILCSAGFFFFLYMIERDTLLKEKYILKAAM